MSFTQFLEEKAVAKVEAQGEGHEATLTEAEKKAKKSYTVKFETGNDSFVEDFEGEVEAVLKQAIKNIQTGRLDKALRDTNGNVVGSVK